MLLVVSAFWSLKVCIIPSDCLHMCRKPSGARECLGHPSDALKMIFLDTPRTKKKLLSSLQILWLISFIGSVFCWEFVEVSVFSVSVITLLPVSFNTRQN